MSPDCELIADYAAKGSETAFRALVARHVNLVFATAVRQVGDKGMAEEITQNVFIALARKAPRLGAFETLAGWLHRTTILESKARIRSELRRKRREEFAAQDALLQFDGESPVAHLVPLLDEALMHLGDSDRLALVLRFLENRELQDVGTALGMSKEAARKRVSRALDRLADFFKKRGFAAACGTTLIAVFAESSQAAAPAGLAVTAANAGLGAAGAIGGFGLVMFHIMTLTKTQTLVICGLLAAAPLTWEWQAQARAEHKYADLQSELAAVRDRAALAEAEASRVNNSLHAVEKDNLDLQARKNLLGTQRDGKIPLPKYHWDDNSPYLRLPKDFVRSLSLYPTTSQRTRLAELTKDLLQINDSESAQLEAEIGKFLSSIYAVQSKKMRLVEPRKEDLQNHPADQTRVFEMPALGDDLSKSRDELVARMTAMLGAERSDILQRGLERVFPMDDQASLASIYPFFPQAHRYRFYQPKPGDSGLAYSVDVPGRGNLGSWIQFDEIPEPFQPALTDWIAIGKTQNKNPEHP